MINKIRDNIFQMHFDEFGSCVYLIKLENKNILIDTSSEENRDNLIQDLSELNTRPEEINHLILTHSHWDHIGNVSLFKNAMIFNSDNIDNLDIKEFKIIKTPGHTMDSICILYGDILFSGDTIFHDGGIGRTDFVESDPKEMIISLNKLHKLKFRVLCPGHL